MAAEQAYCREFADYLGICRRGELRVSAVYVALRCVLSRSPR
jgi:hypothetical protein